MNPSSCPVPSGCSSFLMLLGRICIAVIFILSGIGKFLDPVNTAAYMTSKGIPTAQLFLYAAAIVELLGGFSLFLGFKTRLGSLILLLFLIPTTYIFHNFWAQDPAGAKVEMINFLKNLAIFGGLLYTLAVGPGKLSIDRLCGCDKKKDN